jgi:hypothetical protein
MSAATGRRWRPQESPRAALPQPGQPGDRYLGHTDVGIAIGRGGPDGIRLRLVHSGRTIALTWAEQDRWFQWDAARAAWVLRCCREQGCGRRIGP